MRNGRNYNLQAQNGLSLVELMVVIAIIAIIAALAMMQRGGANEQFQRQNIARELKFALERARFDSVKRRAEGADRAEVVVGATQFTLRTDVNLNTAGLESTVTTLPAGITIVNFDGSAGPATVKFDRHGTTATTGATEPVFLICNGTCSATTDNTTNANIVLVTHTGTVSMLPGGVTPQPSFTPPTVVAPQANPLDINNRVLLPPTPTP